MNINRSFHIVLMALLPMATLHAEDYNDTVRTNSWTMYVSGGISNIHELRRGPDIGVHSTIAHDVGLGVKYNILPWVRVGAYFGYTKGKSYNPDIATDRSVIRDYPIGGYDDGVLTIDRAVIADRSVLHLVGMDMSADLNFLELWPKRNQRWNLWFGMGVGYYHGWNRNSLTTAIREEAIAQGVDHYNIYSKDYIVTGQEDKQVNLLYIPTRLVLSYDLSPRWTLGLKGEYRCMPLHVDYTPKGIWSADLSIAYNFK